MKGKKCACGRNSPQSVNLKGKNRSNDGSSVLYKVGANRMRYTSGKYAVVTSLDRFIH